MLEEAHEEVGVELRKAFCLEKMDNVERTDGRAVRAGCGHCFVNIGDSNDLSEGLYLVAFKVHGVSGAVATLVMHHCGKLDAVVDGLRAKDIIAANGVSLNLAVFLGT